MSITSIRVVHQRSTEQEARQACGRATTVLEMGISAYVRYKGESVEVAFEREDCGPDEWFGYSARAMVEVEEFARLAGVEGPLWGFVNDPWIPPERAVEDAAKLRSFLAELEPGPPGSLTDEGMCGMAHELVSFLEAAGRHDGYVVD